jgi:DNA-binding transcriptional ArsR family regulator
MWLPTDRRVDNAHAADHVVELLVERQIRISILPNLVRRSEHGDVPATVPATSAGACSGSSLELFARLLTINNPASILNHMVYHSRSLDHTFAALADPTRRAILARLANGETTVNELAKPFAMSLPAVSRHLKVLEHAGLISRGRDAQWRPARLEAAPLQQASGWIDKYQRFWDEGFDRLDDYIIELQRKEKSHARNRKKRR